MADVQNLVPDRPALAQLWRKLGYLLSSGVPMMEAIDAIAADLPTTELVPVIAKIKAEIANGRTLSAAIDGQPEVFSTMTVALVRTGELAGEVDKAVERVADGLEAGTIDVGRKKPDRELDPQLAAEADEVQQAYERTTQILQDGIKAHASDIHIEPCKDGARVRYRIDGVMHEVQRMSQKECIGTVARIKIMANVDVSERRRIQDGRILIEIEGKEYDLRINICPYAFGESVVMRILDRTRVMLDINRFGLRPQVVETLDRWCRRPNGIVIVTGPTGSGKTTTLYALLEHINRPEIKITGVENPVEYLLDGINQCEVRERTGMTFASILRAQLRQDPDVMMVGEIRDLETAHICVQAALTGHLVLTTLHTNDAPSALRRLCDMGVEPFLIDNAVIGVKAQKLCRKLCDKCREPYTADQAVRQDLALDSDREPLTLYRAKGCDACFGSGYRGRMAISEIVELNDALRDAIQRRASADDLRKTAIESGMQTMRQNGMESVRAGLTSVEEVQRVTPEV